MMVTGWNPWKLTAIVMALVIVTALITGAVVARWSGTDADRTAGPRPVTPAPTPAASQAPVAPAPAPARRAPNPAATVPPQAAIDACNHYAAARVGQRDKTAEVVKGAAIGGVGGAGAGSLYGLNENKKHDQAYRDAYGVCMRARGYTT